MLLVLAWGSRVVEINGGIPPGFVVVVEVGGGGGVTGRSCFVYH